MAYPADWWVPSSCRDRGCRLIAWQDAKEMRGVVRHGANPEAVCFPEPPRGYPSSLWHAFIARHIAEWADRLHDYEGGVVR